MEQKDLFGNFKYCERCNRPLPLTYQESLCPDCINQQLFSQVKEYIRANDVNEYDVAEHFNIPHHTIKQWIREGRIEYKDQNLNAIKTLYCKKCGAPISFGTLCPKCAKNAGVSVHSTEGILQQDGHMRFLDDSNR